MQPKSHPSQWVWDCKSWLQNIFVHSVRDVGNLWSKTGYKLHCNFGHAKIPWKEPSEDGLWINDVIVASDCPRLEQKNALGKKCNLLPKKPKTLNCWKWRKIWSRPDHPRLCSPVRPSDRCPRTKGTYLPDSPYRQEQGGNVGAMGDSLLAQALQEEAAKAMKDGSLQNPLAGVQFKEVCCSPLFSSSSL